MKEKTNFCEFPSPSDNTRYTSDNFSHTHDLRVFKEDFESVLNDEFSVNDLFHPNANNNKVIARHIDAPQDQESCDYHFEAAGFPDWRDLPVGQFRFSDDAENKSILVHGRDNHICGHFGVIVVKNVNKRFDGDGKYFEKLLKEGYTEFKG